MWPSGKKNNRKGMAIAAGGEIQLPLPPIRFDGEKCFMWIDDKEEQIGEDGFIIEIRADNARPARVRISPDFKNRRLEAMEIIDVEENREYPKDGPKLQFAGLSSVSMDSYVENIKRHIDVLGEDIIKSNRKIKRRFYILAVVLLMVAISQLYAAYFSTGVLRYINTVLVIASISVLCMIMMVIKRANEIDREIKTEIYKNDGKENVVKCPEMEKIHIVKER